MRLVVVGASLAGMRAAQAARAKGFDGELTVIGAEAHPPYTRPPLSKELLGGAQEAADVDLRSSALDVEWRLGVSASELDRDARVVRLADGAEIPYDRVIVATGCRAKSWPVGDVAIHDLNGVHTLRDLDDALRLRVELHDAHRLTIVGAGFIGCEVAATARKRGVEVTLIDIAPTPMLPLGPELGARCADMHRAHGVDLHLGTGVRTVHGDDGRVEAVTLTDGTTIDTDVLLIALGSALNDEWLNESGLQLDGGLVCDETLTSIDDPDVLGAGDIVSWPQPLLRGERARVEHWTVAAEHGRLAGANALLDSAQRAPHAVAPYFWSDQYDVKIQAVGFPARAEALRILESTPGGDRFVAVGERDGRLVGAIGFNAAARVAWYRRRLTPDATVEELEAAIAADPKALGAAVGAQA
ncbi:MAG TPA: FAD-dependent oxidoreductase [Solirubrobacteraceae bacterium]|nr:FAD-dependent oxidoreductase [Solirubrobacteraceae bacterium]